MQKVINVLALTSFLVSTSVVGTVAYLYINKESIIKNGKEALIEEVKSYMSEAFEVPDLPLAPPTNIAIPDVPFTI
jgi:hypothetical protein